MWSSFCNDWREEGPAMVHQPKLIFPPLQFGPTNGTLQGFSDIPIAADPWKPGAPGPCSLWPAANVKDRDEETDATEYTATQKSSAGSSCGDDDWNSNFRSNLAGEFFPGERFGVNGTNPGQDLVDLEPEVGRQRGQELLAMLRDGPLSKGSNVCRSNAGGLGQSYGPSELLSTAMLGQSRQTFSSPWMPLGTVAAQGVRASQVTNWAL
mmetsp:Transcript_22364/g.42160  ORF Transcript_22364/g.42160 Transcript_22364/m.42160 type:complete len:209 (+) Transcript_22364:62-688(+)